MKVVRGYKTELDLNNEQRTACLEHAGASRFAYNWGLARSKEVYRTTGKRPTAIEQHKELNKLKQTNYPWMYEVSKCAPQEALRDLDKAFKNFYRGRKQTLNIGFPEFKKKGCRDSFRLTGTIKVQDDTIQLPRIGLIKLKEKTKVKGRVLSATVSKEIDRWFVSISVEEEIEDPQPIQGEAVGIDLGLTIFAT